MKVKELISELKKMPQNADVGYFYDGAVRGSPDSMFESKSGTVVLLEEYEKESIMYEEDRPKGSPAFPEPPDKEYFSLLQKSRESNGL